MAAHDVQIFRLAVGPQFQKLTEREKRYAHHMSRAAWFGTRIILEQVSPESPGIFDFILELHRECAGNWGSLLTLTRGVESEELRRFLTYAATFLSNIGNYFGSGDQKFVPDVSAEFLQVLASTSPRLGELVDEISPAIQSIPPYGLGYPSDITQSTYYLGVNITEQEVQNVSKLLSQHSLFPENTRIRKCDNDFEVLLASVDDSELGQSFPLPDGSGVVKLKRGDHSCHLERVCAELAEAANYAANERQREFLQAYIESFRTGSLDTYRNSLRSWAKDKSPRVENIFGFVEPYRDPHGTRSEFEGLVGIADDTETALLAKLVESSAKFIRRPPWATPENDGKGPFEKSLFEPPDFSSIYTLAYCSSIIFPGINLQNYNDIRQEEGFKNVIISNRMMVESQAQQYPFIDPSEAEEFQRCKSPAYYWWVVLHELLGHGTGRMMTWTGQFEELATTVDECRAELVGAYLMDDVELLQLFGFDETTEIRAADLTYNLYQQLGVDGLRGLSNFNVDTGKWGQAHSQAHFAILKYLLRDGGGCVAVSHDKAGQRLTVRVDKSKITTHGKPALGRMLLQLHMFRCTADVEGCRVYYKALSKVDGEFVEWRETVLAAKPPPLVFTQANTFLDGDEVVLEEYEPTVEGVIQSWAEREV
ncbi:peptidase family M49-domain-containing protein [Podospora aff. communis PSN243]|uniref:Peptidase family M49-domain-containing protein n=1 Tax=Podospora aff. communis PSN243 TaxID=3040156 RepID=A0AAV9GXK0_9PEZI|nr:peptidase family M49-domain-containing protein [Podospora aff. communis PSN243]